MTDGATAEPGRALRANRASQLWLGVVCMVLIANLQYGWTLFVNPIEKAHGWTLAEIQFAFSLFIATETWLTPIQGWVVDRLGARRGPPLMIALGGVLVAAGWVVNSFADSLDLLYVGALLSGTGGGAVYATCVGNAVKWFPDRRGLAVGLTAAGYGAGTALTVLPIQALIAGAGYQAAFFWFGLGQGAILLLVAPIMRAPLPDEVASRPAARVPQASASATPGQVLGSPVFWLLYVMFVMVSAGGIMATAQIAPIAKDFGFAKTPLFLGFSVISVALIFDNLMNGCARPAFGWVSDHIGRENTMALAFTIGAAAYVLLGVFGADPRFFVLFAGLVFFTWGEIFSLFPSTCTDTFGTRYATVNAGLLYTAKGTSAFIVPLANIIKHATGSWHAVFMISGAGNLVVVLLALFVLKPLRRRYARAQGAAAVRPATAAA
jgi:OFA family oxalate/formate antiporter-like MFS transporter